MRQRSLTIIRDEHQALSAMLRSLHMLVAQSRRQGGSPPFEVLRAMLFYIDEFPERLHHAKESGCLFPLLRQRVPRLGPVLDALDADHGRGEHAVRELEHRLLAFEMMGESRRAAFEDALDTYLRFYMAHMATEEEQVLPAALANFTEADWATVDAAFEANRDPLTGHAPEPEYEPLFQKILMTAPAPVGLGEALHVP